jgi:hypothetical protein
MTAMISMRTCKKRLAVLWFVGGLLLFLLLVFQSIFGKYGTEVDAAWSWFLPTIMPTLSLMLGVLILDATTTGGTDKLIEQFMFYMAFGLSLVYLVLVGVIPLVQPFTGSSPLDLMNQSSIWLGPLQGLVAAALGAFFVKGERGGRKVKPAPD